jgi:hypothetical protein
LWNGVLRLHLGADRQLSGDTGWRIRRPGFLSGPDYASYQLESGRIFGACAGGQYWLADDGRLYGPDSAGEFYLVEGRLYGPGKPLPWVATMAALRAELEKRANLARLAEPQRPFPELVRDFLTAHGLPCEQSEAEPAGLTVEVDGVHYLALPSGLLRERDISGLQDVARSVAMPLLVFSSQRHQYPSERNRPDEPPIILVSGDDLDYVLEGQGSFVPLLQKKVELARSHGVIYNPPPPHR